MEVFTAPAIAKLLSNWDQNFGYQKIDQNSAAIMPRVLEMTRRLQPLTILTKAVNLNEADHSRNDLSAEVKDEHGREGHDFQSCPQLPAQITASSASDKPWP